MRPIVQSMVARVSFTRLCMSSATRRSRSVVASSSSTNSYKNDNIKCLRNRCTVMSSLVDNRIQTIQYGTTASLSSYNSRVNIYCRQFSSHNEQQKADIKDSNEKVANDEIEDADLMAEVQDANKRYVVYRYDDMIHDNIYMLILYLFNVSWYSLFYAVRHMICTKQKQNICSMCTLRI